MKVDRVETKRLKTMASRKRLMKSFTCPLCLNPLSIDINKEWGWCQREGHPICKLWEDDFLTTLYKKLFKKPRWPQP